MSELSFYFQRILCMCVCVLVFVKFIENLHGIGNKKNVQCGIVPNRKN